MKLDTGAELQELLETTAAHAARFVNGLETRHVSPKTSLPELRQAFPGRLPETGLEPRQVIDELVGKVEPGLLATPSGRFFGWVMGGTLPAALAADWLTSAWDQNAAIVATSPAAAAIEEVCGAWLKELLPIPLDASFALVTGSQMGHLTALAAARHHLLGAEGWDVESRGLTAAPPVRVVASELHHESIERAVRMLGIGTDAIALVSTEPSGAIQLEALATAVDRASEAPTIVCLQAGELNSGAFDPFREACELARNRNAWTHIDGAFGLWAAASDSLRHLLVGAELADSWVADGHKWLNTPFDIGFVFVAHPDAHRGAMMTHASYFSHDIVGRDQMNWNPEWSRRARGFAVYAALRSLGRRGVAELIERSVHYAQQLVAQIGALKNAEVLAEPIVNQGLVRFLASDGNHDRRTDSVIAHLQQNGEAWFGGTTWGGARAMRVSVCNWRTTDADVDRALAAVDAALKATA